MSKTTSKNLSRRSVLAGSAAATLAAILPSAFTTSTQAGEGGKSIVIWFSRTGSVEQLAHWAVEATGADQLKLELVEPYAESYGAMTDIAREERRTGKRREIRTTIPDLSGYDTIYLGSPYWWGGLSVPMLTFLADHNMAGKTVKCFVVSASSGPSGAWADLKRLCPNATIPEGFHTTERSVSGAKAEFEAWLKK